MASSGDNSSPVGVTDPRPQVPPTAAVSAQWNAFSHSLTSSLTIKLDRANYLAWKSQVVPTVIGHDLDEIFALSSEPRDYECNGLHKHSKAVSTGTLTLGLCTTVLSVLFVHDLLLLFSLHQAPLVLINMNFILYAIFAAPRCSDVPDLLLIKNLFSTKYGKAFVSSVSELRPDSVSAPSPKVKLKVLKEIAREYNLEWDSSNAEAELSKRHEDLLAIAI
ncbi:hypothetical protein G4B88_007104 [Cannabis sativa]|uniref:Retrotransposon Copia-like N-terminal domain-containing protein n=1 Tax=Cannabis sativa TaxID=3483 RepID=A0A7J6GNK4_CANSA|nr:hypothetical protein G4B88_007104 [Cannabis sativa]